MRCRRKPGEILGFFFMTAVLLMLDQLTKKYAAACLKGGMEQSFIPGLLELMYVENSGMAFGLLEGAFGLFFLVSILAAMVILFEFLTLPDGKGFRMAKAGMSLMLAGCCGNLTDRLLHRYVIDFINFVPISFPVFNLADCCVVTGTGLLVLWLILFTSEETNG